MKRPILKKQFKAATRICIAMNGLPKMQDDLCVIAARMDIKLHGIPADDKDIINRAAAIAEGLFDPAYKVSEYQRLEWIDMCERALRKVIAEGEAV